MLSAVGWLLSSICRSARLAPVLAWIPADISSPAIRAAMATVLHPDGSPATPGDLIPLTDLAQQLEG